MKTRLLYAFLGAALALGLTFGALKLRAQDTYSGPKWEYLWYQMTPGHKFTQAARRATSICLARRRPAC